MVQTTDPVTREIVKNALMSAADTMALTVVRTARSAVIKHGMDFSTALFTADGQQVAQGLTLPPHLGSMAPALEGVMNAFGDDVEPGDVFANNDPYEGASHLPDIFLFKPIFVNDTLMGWSCCIGHQTDIGGRVAGGNACDNIEIYQEGLILPPLKLYAKGELHQAVWRILEKNVRVPEKVLGDVQALLAAVRFVERDLLRVVDDYAHHPTEVAAVLATARTQSHKRLIVVFQPHRFSRTARCFQQFARVLSVADVVVLTDIFAAGESPISGVTAGRLADAVRQETDRPVHHAGTLGEALALVSDVARSGDLVVTLGAGSIGGLGDRLLAARQKAVDADRQPGSEIS